MIKKKIGFIGCGNMGGAIIRGLITRQVFSASDIIASSISPVHTGVMKDQFGIAVTMDNAKAASKSDILVLAVKPNVFDTVIPEIRDQIREDTLIISIAAGQTIANIEALFERPIHLVRVMPNTPALVGESMSALCRNEAVTDEEMAIALAIFNSLGEAEVVDEHLMDCVTGISGSSPAYVYMFIEAMADAAVADGMPRSQAYKFAAQSVLGSAKMVLETGRHPGALKDDVCSPGGTTIEAVTVLEEEGFRNAVIKAQRACVRKSFEMSQKD